MIYTRRSIDLPFAQYAYSNLKNSFITATTSRTLSLIQSNKNARNITYIVDYRITYLSDNNHVWIRFRYAISTNKQ